MKFTATFSAAQVRSAEAASVQYRKDLRRAAKVATDRASRDAQTGLKERIASTGLGRLGGAVAQTSALQRRQEGDPYGVVFAKGGDESRAGGALEAYSQGARITPRNPDGWLWIPTRAVPRLVSVNGRRYRNTPALYQQSGLLGSIGKLEFRPLGARKAIMVIKRVTLSAKTGQAKRAGPGRTRTRIPQKEVIAFVGIKVTTRAKRFDKDGVVGFYARRVPRYMEEALGEIRRGRV